MGFSMASVMPHLARIGGFLKMGVDHYATLRAAGEYIGPEGVAVFLQEKMADWNPEVKGKALLDDETRAAGARFLAGVAVNFSQV